MLSKFQFTTFIALICILLTSCSKNKGLTDDQRNRANENHRKYNQTFENEQKKN